MNDDASSGTSTGLYRATVLGDADAGEIMTLQRAAYVTEAQAHNDLHLPPLTQGLDELRAELGGSNVVALGVREEGRLIAAVRLRRIGSTVELGRLTVAPDRQGKGIGSFLLGEAEKAFPEAREMQLFTGERSSANIRLYERSQVISESNVRAADPNTNWDLELWFSIMETENVLNPVPGRPGQYSLFRTHHTVTLVAESLRGERMGRDE